MHWLLARLLRKFPGAARCAGDRGTLRPAPLREAIAGEVAYLARPGAKSFERTYGWAWLLKLAEELGRGAGADFARWRANLAPLAQAFVARYLDYLPKAAQPLRAGMHSNSAFGLAFAIDYARACDEPALSRCARRRRARGSAAIATIRPRGNHRVGLPVAGTGRSRPDAARAGTGRVRRVARALPALVHVRGARGAVHPGGPDRPRRSADRAPRRPVAVPRVVLRRHRRRTPARRSAHRRGDRGRGRPPPRRVGWARKAATTWVPTGSRASPRSPSRVRSSTAVPRRRAAEGPAARSHRSDRFASIAPGSAAPPSRSAQR